MARGNGHAPQVPVQPVVVLALSAEIYGPAVATRGVRESEIISDFKHTQVAVGDEAKPILPEPELGWPQEALLAGPEEEHVGEPRHDLDDRQGPENSSTLPAKSPTRNPGIGLDLIAAKMTIAISSSL